MKKFKVTMKQVCKQVVEVEAESKDGAIQEVMQGRGKVIFKDFRPTLSPVVWEVEEIK